MLAVVKDNYQTDMIVYDFKIKVPKITARRLYFIKQRVFGVILLVISMILPFIFENKDASASLILFPLAMYLILTKSKVIYDKII